ncbi:MAG: GGDEF domain-containing protein [Hyphomonas sp.]
MRSSGSCREGLKNSDTFNDILSEANDLLPKSVTPGALGGILANLVKENRRMAATTHQLHAGLQESQKQIETLNKELEEVQYQSLRDPLTAVSNRRAFDKRLVEDVQNAFDNGEKLCLAIADLDYFKKVNDTYGHQTGDDVLQMFASIIMKNIKGADMVARIGGEEFAIILPQTDVFAAYNLMVKIKRAFRDAELTCARSGRVLRELTASFGISRYQPGMTPDQMMEEADSLLYMAKNEGRDRVKAKGL